MADLDRFFEKTQPLPHPKVRFWRALVEEGKVARLSVEVWRDPLPLSVNPPRLFVHFYDTQGRETRSPEEFDWDPKVNDELLRLKARAIDPENEGYRFGLVLRSRFASIETPFGELPKVSQLLDEIHCADPREGAQQEACAELIEEVFGSCFDSLHEVLKYSKEQTISIMGEAVAAYLDERFSVSDRRAIGFV